MILSIFVIYTGTLTYQANGLRWQLSGDKVANLTQEKAYCLFVIRILQEQKKKEQEGEEFGEIIAEQCFDP